MVKFKIQKLRPKAKLPEYAHPGDAGMDIFSVEKVTLKPGELKTISTGISMEFPDGYAALMWDKGGLSNKHGLKVVGGVYDCGFRGEYTVGIINLSKKKFIFNVGDKLCQIIVQKYEHAKIVESNSLNRTSRGKGRHGSTGK